MLKKKKSALDSEKLKEVYGKTWNLHISILKKCITVVIGRKTELG